PSSRPASPAVRRGKGKKPAAPLPTFTGRRSKAERDARIQEGLERERERNKDREKAEERKRKAEERRAKSEAARGRGRGGYAGVASGPFSQWSIKKEKRPASGGFSGYGGGSGSRATQIKSESAHGSSSTHRSSGVSIKREDGGYISSEDENDEDAEFPRQDIDYIDISPDEDEATPRDTMALPVRIRRNEHKERVVGINTEASTEASAKALQKAEETRSAPTADALKRTSNKGKGKTKDFEITGERKPYKGVWQDSDESDVKVKTEPTSEDEEMLDAEHVGIGASVEKAAKQAELSPEAEKKPKINAKAVPTFQTDEESAEWTRFQNNLQINRSELGPDTSAPAQDGPGDVAMADANSKNKRDDYVYLFQLPPIMPELIAPGIKKEHSDAPATKPVTNEAAPQAGAVPIKKEGDFSDPVAEVPERPRFTSGYVGKLRVHQSGRTTLDWGGTSYELTPGNEATFLQEVVSIHVVPEKDRVVEEDAGEAISFGQIRGKFVVTPDFGQLL
ncbi:hypothetical protein K458DRAFT_238977, partial [Lentithecium fluviatile CBS 122367]